MMSDDGSQLILLHKIARKFDGRVIFRDVDFGLDKGQVVLVVGANGAGKTTLLKIMAGIVSPSSGEVRRFVGDEKTAYLGHSLFIYPRLTAMANLRFWAGIYGIGLTDGQLMDVLERVDLKKRALEQAGRFSRGMSQRLNLARVLMQNPDLIFLDEPATGLDMKSRETLEREITEAARRGAGIVWVSHDYERDARFAHKVLKIEDKRAAFV